MTVRRSEGPQPVTLDGGDDGAGGLRGFFAAITAGVGSLAGRAEAHDRDRGRRAELLRQLWTAEIPAQRITATGQTIDLPDILGPKNGFAWDLRFIRMGTAAASGSFGGGIVAVHKRQSASATSDDPNELFEATSVQSIFPGSGVWVLMPGDRLVLQSSGTINTTITIYGSFVQVPLPLLPEYLL